MDNLLEELNKESKPFTDDSKLILQPKKPEMAFNLYDFLFPGGKLAKLVKKLNFPDKFFNVFLCQSVESMILIEKKK